MSEHEGGVVPLAEVVRDAFFDRRTGILAVSGAGRQVSLYFDAGNIFYCKSDDPSQRLDRILVRWGLAEEAAVASVVQRAGRDVRGGLVREGLFPSAAAFDEFMAQVLRERMADTFALPGAVGTFRDEGVTELNELPFPTTTPNVILEGVRRMADAGRILLPLSDDDATLSLNPQSSVPLQSMAMSPTEGYVLSQINGVTSLGDVASVSPLGPEQTLRLVYGLLILDVLQHPAFAGYRFHVGELARRRHVTATMEAEQRQAIQAEYARVLSLDPFQVIPGAQSMAAEALTAAVREYQDRWNSGRFSERVARDLREQLLMIVGKAGEALLATLGAASRRRPVTSGSGSEDGGEEGFAFKRMELSKSDTQARVDEDQERAIRLHGLAVEAIKAKDWHQAIQLLSEAVRLGETGERQALLGDCLGQNPHWGKRAEAAYRRAMQLEQFNAAHPFALARMYIAHGLKERAREVLGRVLELQPDHAGAKQALKELRGR